jgi:TonB family protein
MVHAQEVPTYPALPCEGACPQFLPAKHISRPIANFQSEQVQAGEEGAVSLSFTIGTDGRVRNVVIEQVVGSPSLAKNALQQALATSFQPATEDGKPVEENAHYRYMYIVSGSRHPKIIQAYKEALAEKTPADEIAALKAIEGSEQLTLYEITMIKGALAQLEAEAGDDGAALRDIEIATLSDGQFLDKREVEQALRLQIVLEAHAGQYGAALATFDALKKLKDVTVTDNDPEAQLISKLQAEIGSMKPLWASAEIPEDPTVLYWDHLMVRRSFGFANIKGSLTKFSLRCQSHGIDSPVSETATWTIPSSWTKCNIFVEGTPGTTFQFGEAQTNAASTQAKPNAN